MTDEQFAAMHKVTCRVSSQARKGSGALRSATVSLHTAQRLFG